MKNKKFIRPPVFIAVALIAVLSLSVIAFAAVPIVWRHLDVRIVEGGDDFYFSAKVSECGSMSVMTMVPYGFESENSGPTIIEVDGVIITIGDALILDNIEDAIALLTMENVRIPAYLPEGFTFTQAVFPVNPTAHPDAPWANKDMFMEFTNGSDIIHLRIMHWYQQRGMLGLSPYQEDITINSTKAAVADGVLVIVIDDAEYVFTAESLTRDQLIRMAESMR